MRVVAPLALLLVVLVLALSTSGTPGNADLVFVGPDVFTLDPQKMSYMQDLRMEMALDEALFVRDSETCDPVPGACEKFETSADGREWTFHIRAVARWSDGSPLEAEDFRLAWMRALLPDTAADYSGFFFCIAGAREFFQWREQALLDYAREEQPHTAEAAAALWQLTLAEFDRRVGIHCPDAHTLVVTLTQPLPYLADLLAFGVTSPVQRVTIARFTRIEARTGRVETDPEWTKPGNRPSNGPYMLADWRYKRHLLLEANPYYWNAAAVGSQRVLMLPFENNSTAVLAYGVGGIDWISEVSVDYRADMAAQQAAYESRQAEQLRAARDGGATRTAALAAGTEPQANERRDLHVLRAYGTDFFQFNCRPKLADGRDNPFADARVRRAFARAVDKQLLVDRVTRMHEPVSGGLVPPGSIAGYQGPAGLGFDPAAARAELESAGWRDRDGDGLVEDDSGAEFPVVDLLYTTGAVRYKNLALALRDMWSKALGVQMELRSKDTKFFKEDLRTGNFMIARGGWYGDYGDPTTYLEFCRSTDGNNDRRYNCPEFDSLLDDAAKERDPQRRFEMLHRAEAMLVERDLPLIPLCTFVQVYMFEPGELTGLTEHPRLEQYLSRLKRQPQS